MKNHWFCRSYEERAFLSYYWKVRFYRIFSFAFIYLFSFSLFAQHVENNGEPQKVRPEVLLREIKGFGTKIERIENLSDKHGKYKRTRDLADLGFKQTPNAIKLAKYDAIVKARDRITSFVDRYRVQYPENPFLTKQEMERIAAKYSMVIGDPSDYIGGIPDRNQEEILNFVNRVAGQPKLYVMAPVAMFDMTARDIDGVYIVDKDPIVFIEVEGGVLYVTHWGDDAIEPMKEIGEIVEQFGYLPEKSNVVTASRLVGTNILSDQWIWVSGTIDTVTTFSDTLWSE